MDLTIANQGSSVLRDYRKGNWNLQETMVLIEAKKMDDERRMKRLGDTAERGKPAELRWKWVEDYCWNNGCYRSQNQCNDKWDNLMRDFKKVREFERRVGESVGGEEKSYWRMEKTERKDNNLPSNMLRQIYEALLAVVERKAPTPALVAGSSAVMEKSTSHFFGQLSMPSPIQQCPIAQAPPILPPLPLPLPPAQNTSEPLTSLPPSQSLPTVDSDASEYSGSPAKRRKRRDGVGVGGGEGTSGVGAASATTLEEVGSAISKSASIIAKAIQSCEEREGRRHIELLDLHERRLKIEESKAEINRQGINGLVDAINNLANSMLALAGHRTQPSSK